MRLVSRGLPLAMFVFDWTLYCLGQLLRPFSFVRKRWSGADPLSTSKLAAVYVHFDREGVIHDYVIHQLAELAATGFRITFVSNSRKFSDASAAQVAPFCRTILWRRNVGYDFGAYKDGMNAIEDKESLTALLLMNDSVYGPFSKLKDCLAEIDRTSTDFWGITDSWALRYHVQSYFILFFRNVLVSSAFQKFWKRFPYVNHKGWIIRHGEVWLSHVLTRQKFRANVLAPYWSVAKTVLDRLSAVDLDNPKLPDVHKSYLRDLTALLIRGQATNPMHYFWETLITDYRCPFIKRELMKSNPASVPFAWRWPEVIERTSGYDISLIRRHLQSLDR